MNNYNIKIIDCGIGRSKHVDIQASSELSVLDELNILDSLVREALESTEPELRAAILEAIECLCTRQDRN